MNTAPVFHVGQFQSKYKELLQEQKDDQLEKTWVDVRWISNRKSSNRSSCDDAKMLTKFEEIDSEIKRELAGFPRIQRIPHIMEKNAKLISMNPEQQEDIPKNRRKDVNYITSYLEKDQNLPVEKLPKDEVILSVAIFHPQKHMKVQVCWACNLRFLEQ